MDAEQMRKIRVAALGNRGWEPQSGDRKATEMARKEPRDRSLVVSAIEVGRDVRRAIEEAENESKMG